MLLLELIEDCQGEIYRYLSQVSRLMLATTCHQMQKFREKLAATTLIKEVIEDGSPTLYEYFGSGGPEWSRVWILVMSDPANIAYFAEKIPFPALLNYMRKVMSFQPPLNNVHCIVMEFALTSRTTEEIKILSTYGFKSGHISINVKISFCKLGGDARVVLGPHLGTRKLMWSIRPEEKFIWKCRHWPLSEGSISSEEIKDFSRFTNDILLNTITFNHFTLFGTIIETLRSQGQVSTSQMNILLVKAFAHGRTNFVKYLMTLGAKFTGQITWTTKNIKVDLLDLMLLNINKNNLIEEIPPFWPRDDTWILRNSKFTWEVFAYFYAFCTPGGKDATQAYFPSDSYFRVYCSLEEIMGNILDLSDYNQEMTIEQIGDLVMKINAVMDMTSLIKIKINQVWENYLQDPRLEQYAALEVMIGITQGIDVIREYTKGMISHLDLHHDLHSTLRLGDGTGCVK